MGVSGTPAPWGSKPEQKVGPRWGLLIHLLSQNRVPKLSDPGPPPLNLLNFSRPYPAPISTPSLTKIISIRFRPWILNTRNCDIKWQNLGMLNCVDILHGGNPDEPLESRKLNLLCTYYIHLVKSVNLCS